MADVPAVLGLLQRRLPALPVDDSRSSCQTGAIPWHKPARTEAGTIDTQTGGGGRRGAAHRRRRWQRRYDRAAGTPPAAVAARGAIIGRTRTGRGRDAW